MAHGANRRAVSARGEIGTQRFSGRLRGAIAHEEQVARDGKREEIQSHAPSRDEEREHDEWHADEHREIRTDEQRDSKCCQNRHANRYQNRIENRKRAQHDQRVDDMEGDPHTREDHQHRGHCEKKPNGITGHRLREKSSDRRGVCGITRRHRNRGHCRNDRRQEDARGHERRELRFEVFTRVEHFAQRQWNHRRREFLETQPEQQSGAGDEQPGIGVERKCAAFGRKAA